MIIIIITRYLIYKYEDNMYHFFLNNVCVNYIKMIPLGNHKWQMSNVIVQNVGHLRKYFFIKAFDRDNNYPKFILIEHSNIIIREIIRT